ncbi:aspartyl-phosphate phosphatase Spo0E family protein [Paenibacillus sp. PK4536]|uniref:aspartyl-phosphate phosphatase Spo0E family protein n=1 Tax=Paenibacillus sp. PK4536 TaxID=3024576 RepID=UPI003313075F
MIKVEKERVKLHRLVNKYGLADLKVLKQSQYLDTCLNAYRKIEIQHNNDTKNKIRY